MMSSALSMMSDITDALSVEEILKRLSTSAEVDNRVWEIGCSELLRRKTYSSEDAFDAAREQIKDAMIKGLSADDQDVLVKTAARAKKGGEPPELSALRRVRETIMERLKKRIQRLREHLLPSKVLRADVKNMKALLAELPKDAFSMTIVAPRRCGKTVFVRSLVELLTKGETPIIAEVHVFSGTAEATKAFDFLSEDDSVQEFDGAAIQELMDTHTATSKRILVIVDDVLGNTKAANCAPLITLFTQGRNFNIAVAVLTQSLTRVTIPAMKTNSDLLAFADLTKDDVKSLQGSSFAGLNATQEELLTFTNHHTGPAHDHNFAVYNREKKRVIIVNARLTSSSVSSSAQSSPSLSLSAGGSSGSRRRVSSPVCAGQGQFAGLATTAAAVASKTHATPPATSSMADLSDVLSGMRNVGAAASAAQLHTIMSGRHAALRDSDAATSPTSSAAHAAVAPLNLADSLAAAAISVCVPKQVVDILARHVLTLCGRKGKKVTVWEPQWSAFRMGAMLVSAGCVLVGDAPVEVSGGGGASSTAVGRAMPPVTRRSAAAAGKLGASTFPPPSPPATAYAGAGAHVSSVTEPMGTLHPCCDVIIGVLPRGGGDKWLEWCLKATRKWVCVMDSEQLVSQRYSNLLRGKEVTVWVINQDGSEGPGLVCVGGGWGRSSTIQWLPPSVGEDVDDDDDDE